MTTDTALGHALLDAVIVSLVFVLAWNLGVSPPLAVVVAAAVSVALPWRARGTDVDARRAHVIATGWSAPGLAIAAVFAIWFTSWPHTRFWTLAGCLLPPMVWGQGALGAAIVGGQPSTRDSSPRRQRVSALVLLVVLLALGAGTLVRGASGRPPPVQDAYWASLEPLAVTPPPPIAWSPHEQRHLCWSRTGLGACRYGLPGGVCMAVGAEPDDPYGAIMCGTGEACSQPMHCPTLQVGRDPRTSSLVVRKPTWDDHRPGVPSLEWLRGESLGGWLGPITLARATGVPFAWVVLLWAAAVVAGLRAIRPGRTSHALVLAAVAAVPAAVSLVLGLA